MLRNIASAAAREQGAKKIVAAATAFRKTELQDMEDTSARMNDVDRLAVIADKFECTELVARVARAIDRCDAILLTYLFHPDATDDHGMFSGTASDFIAWVMPVLATMKRA